MAIQSMVTRKDYAGRLWGPNQRVTVDEALTIATINGAYASSEEHLKGSIAAGKLADFVMLEQDPHTADPDQIKNIRVNRTVVGGKTMYRGRVEGRRRTQFSARCSGPRPGVPAPSAHSETPRKTRQVWQ